MATAVGLLSAAALFTVGTNLERHEQHKSATASAVKTSPAIDASPSPSNTPLLTTTPSHAVVMPRRTPAQSSDPGLKAPEGSKEREAAERRRRLASQPPSPANTPTPPTQTAAAPTATATAMAAAGDPAAPEGSAAREAAEVTGGSQNRHAEAKLFGIDTELNAVIALADVLALLLLGAVLLSPMRRPFQLVALTIVVSSGGTDLLDVREAPHQNTAGRHGLVALVVLVAVAHAMTASMAAALAIGTRQRAAH